MDDLVRRYEIYQRKAWLLNRMIVTYIIVLIGAAIIIPEVLEAVWVLIVVGAMMAASYFALMQEGRGLARELRQFNPPEKRKRDENMTYTVGDDGELVPLTDEEVRSAGRSL